MTIMSTRISYRRKYHALCLAAPILAAAVNSIGSHAIEKNEFSGEQQQNTLTRRRRRRRQLSDNVNDGDLRWNRTEDNVFGRVTDKETENYDLTSVSVRSSAFNGEQAQIMMEEIMVQARQGGISSTTSDNSCELNDKGFFGDPIGEFYEIQYLYQTTVPAGTPTVQITTVIAPALDLAITSTTIPFLFPQCTPSTSRRQQRRMLLRRNLQSDDFSTINAISSLPEDQFIMSACKFWKEAVYLKFCC
jgi:hypothetical protein